MALWFAWRRAESETVLYNYSKARVCLMLDIVPAPALCAGILNIVFCFTNTTRNMSILILAVIFACGKLWPGGKWSAVAQMLTNGIKCLKVHRRYPRRRLYRRTCVFLRQCPGVPLIGTCILVAHKFFFFD